MVGPKKSRFFVNFLYASYRSMNPHQQKLGLFCMKATFLSSKICLGATSNSLFSLYNKKRFNKWIDVKEKENERKAVINKSVVLEKEKNRLSKWWMYGTFGGFGFFFFNAQKKENVRCFANAKDTAAAQVQEVEVGKANDFEEGKIYEIKVFDGKSSVLVTKTNGEFHCTGAFCSHYNAPLVKGVLAKDHVTCPWHDAEFDLKTGKPINGPAFNAIPVYPIRVEDDKIIVILPNEIKKTAEIKVAKRDLKNKEVYVIVGGGAAAIGAAESLRQNGFTGRIIMLSKEEHLPYDRIVLSKNLSADIQKIKLHDEEFFVENEIELKKKSEVRKISTLNNFVELTNGDKIFYNKVLIATGCKPRFLDVPGNKLKNIFVLRSIEDAQEINKFAKKGLKIAVIGSSFIGMEVAASLAKREATVTVISKESVPFERTLGAKVGGVFKNILKENNIKFFPNKNIKAFLGDNEGKVEGVELDNQDVIQCDAVVLGVGVQPNTHFIEGISLHKNDASILVDPFMKSIENENVYAAGDVASYPYIKTGENIRIEHWVSAIQQGRVAAANMCGMFTPYTHIPFFWTMIGGKSLRYAGHCSSFDEVICEGDVANCKFVAYYVKNNKIVAVATMNKDPVCVAACEIMKMNQMPTPAEITLGIANSQTILQTLQESTLSLSKKKKSMIS